MENNIYHEFFEELKKFLLDLGIENEEKVKGCTDEEIQQIEEQFGKLPLAYKEYLKIIGRKFLWSFFDAEQFSYEDYKDIQKFMKRVIKTTNFVSDKKFIPISHRRYEYLRLIYTDGNNDDPELFYLVEYPYEDEVNPIPSEKNLTKTMIAFFRSTLKNYPFSFFWVTEEEKNENSNVVEDRYLKWLLGLNKIKNELTKTNNPLINELHNVFMTYYNVNNNQKFIDEKTSTNDKHTELQNEEKYINYIQTNNSGASRIKYNPPEEESFINKILRFIDLKW